MAPSVTKGRRLWRRAVWSGRRHTPRLSNRCPMPCQSGVTGRVARQTKTARQAGIEASSTVPHCQGASAHPKAPARRRAVVAGSRPNVGSSSHQSQTSPDTRPRLRRRIAARSGVPAPPWMKTRIWRSLVERATSRNEGSRAARAIRHRRRQLEASVLSRERDLARQIDPDHRTGHRRSRGVPHESDHPQGPGRMLRSSGRSRAHHDERHSESLRHHPYGHPVTPVHHPRTG